MNRTQMTAPFAEEELRQFQGRGGKTMTFIEDETVMDRLDAGYGFGNWQIVVEPVDTARGVVKVRLGVRETGEWIWYEDFGYPNQPDGDVLKEAVSDGIRRCGRYVGIARDLYRKSTYEPGGALGPKLERPADEAAYTETEELTGRIRRKGTVRKGTADGYKLDARLGPEGHVFGFRLDVGADKNIPQCVVDGPLGEALYLALGGKPESLLGKVVTAAGILYHVRSSKGGSWYRLHVDLIETADFTLPAEGAPSEPSVEADAAGGPVDENRPPALDLEAAAAWDAEIAATAS